MKKSRRLLALVIAVISTLSLASCGEGSDTSSAGTGASSETASLAPAPSLDELNLPEINVENKEITLMCGSEFDDFQKRMHEGLLRDYGITVKAEVVPYESLATLLRQKITSGEAPDLYSMANTDYPGLLARDLFLPLKDYVDLEDKVWQEDLPKMENWKWKGEYYLAGGSSGVSRFLWYNKTIFADAGLETPIELYDKGEWDWDKLLEYAKELTVEDENGQITRYGFAGESLQYTFRGSVGEDYIKFTENGVENNFRSPNVAKAEKFLQDLFITHKVVPTDTTISSFDLFMQNKVAMGIYGHWFAFSAEGATERLKAGEIEFAPPPKAPGMEPWYYGDVSGLLIPKGAKNPEGAGAYLTYRAYYNRVEEETDQGEVSPWMKTNIDAGWTEDMVRIYEEVNDSPNIMAHLYTGIGNAMDWAWEPYTAVTTGTPWETVVEEYAPKMEAAIQQFNASLN